MQRLGKNNGRYQGERIDIQQVLREVEQVAVATGWQREPLLLSENNLLPAFRRLVPNARYRIYISTGIHGDEPAGPLAALRLLQEDRWPENVSAWLIPCLNPGGYVQNRREDADGVDLNRDYRSPKTALVRTHIAWLERQPRFDVTLLLHEDWESAGFYLYELNPSHGPSLAPAILDGVREVCPIDMSPVIEERRADQGLIRANPNLMERPDWPEAFYLIHHKSRLSYTLEAPSDFALATRVNALVAGVRAALDRIGAGW